MLYFDVVMVIPGTKINSQRVVAPNKVVKAEPGQKCDVIREASKPNCAQEVRSRHVQNDVATPAADKRDVRGPGGEFAADLHEEASPERPARTEERVTRLEELVRAFRCRLERYMASMED